ncbi:hypothetical protein ACVXHB_15845 [Escherichia coli]
MKPEHLHGIFVFTQTSCCCCRRRSSSHGQRSRFPSTATARKGFAGYDHPNQYLVKPATTIADNIDASNAASGAG